MFADCQLDGACWWREGVPWTRKLMLFGAMIARQKRVFKRRCVKAGREEERIGNERGE